MNSEFDINKFIHTEEVTEQYDRQLERLKQQGMETDKLSIPFALPPLI